MISKKILTVAMLGCALFAGGFANGFVSKAAADQGAFDGIDGYLQPLEGSTQSTATPVDELKLQVGALAAQIKVLQDTKSGTNAEMTKLAELAHIVTLLQDNIAAETSPGDPGQLAFLADELISLKDQYAVLSSQILSPKPVTDEQILEATISSLQNLLTKKTISVKGLAEKYLERIKQLDRAGPGLRAVIEVNPDLIAEARRLDALPDAQRGPLHGIPVLLKDNIDTGDKMQTTAGSWVLMSTRPAKDSVVAAKLRAAGALLLGKANLSEWANFRSARASNGWSGRGGQTLNPYLLSAEPWGSSTGSAVGVAANLCTLAIGTETNGSIIAPSGVNGIVGIKPTVGLTSRAGVIPISHNQDTVGPMARTVTDAAILLGVIAGVPEAEPGDIPSEDPVITDYRPFLKKDGLKGARIGYYYRAPEPYLVDLLIKNGATLVKLEYEFIAGTDELSVLNWDFKNDLEKYLVTRVVTTDPKYSSLPAMKTLQDVLNATEKDPREMDTTRGSYYFKAAIDETNQDDQAAKNRAISQSSIDKIMTEQNISAILTEGVFPTEAAAMAGYPRIAIPFGVDYNGVPKSITMTGGAYQEGTLIQLGYAIEQALLADSPDRGRVQPKFLPDTKQIR